MVQIQDCKAILLVEENMASLSLAENTTMKEGKLTYFCTIITKRISPSL